MMLRGIVGWKGEAFCRRANHDRSAREENILCNYYDSTVSWYYNNLVIACHVYRISLSIFARDKRLLRTHLLCWSLIAIVVKSFQLPWK